MSALPMESVEISSPTPTSKSNAPEPPETTKSTYEFPVEEWDEHTKVKYAYTSEDILRNMNDFTVALPWTYIRKNDGFLPVLFKEKRCIIETPVSICLFGLEKYQNPDSRIVKWSLNFSVKTDGNKEMEQFVLAISQLDKFAQQFKVNEKDKFQTSFQTQRRNKTPTMRIKIPSYKKQLNIKLFIDKDEIDFPSIEEFQTYVRFDTRVSLILMINNIWLAANRYGLSYKLLKVRIHDDPTDVQFRG
jgi:hypothetical protein